MNTNTLYRYRCAGCGVHLTKEEIEGDGHKVVEYLEGCPVWAALCGPVYEIGKEP